MIGALLSAGIACSAGAALQDHSATAHPEDPEPVTIIAVPSNETRAAAAGWSDGRDWHAQHEDCVLLAQAPRHQLVLLGDSITQSFGGPGRRTGQPGRAIFDRVFEGLRVANMGISGDRTQHLLWRLENGALSGPCPEAYVLAIGTNNIGRDTPEEIASGIEKLLRLIRSERPDAVILLCPILPRGFQPADPSRRAVVAVNALIRPFSEREGIEWIDCEGQFLEPDGSLRRPLYGGDGLHLARPGYTVWGEAIMTTLASSRTEPTREDDLE